MDRTASALIAFAAKPENLERRAAAMLLMAELGLDDPKALAAAEDALASPTVLQEFALRYFEKLRPPGGLPALVALLDAADSGIRERLKRLVLEYGGAAVAAIAAAARTQDRSKLWLGAAAEILGTIATEPALRALAALLAGGDAELARTASDTLHRTIRALPDDARPAMSKRILAVVARPDVAANPAAMVTFTRACGALELATARQWLLANAGREDDRQLQSEALHALGACLRREKLLAKEVAVLSKRLADGDFSRIVRPALELLEGHHFGADAQPFLLGLRESPHVPVRAFALAKLGESEAPGAVRALLSSFADTDAVRRSAAGSLRKIPEARQALMKTFIAATDPSAAFTMAETLAGYGLPWREPVLEQIWRRWIEATEREDRIQGAYLQFLRAAAPAFLADALRKRGAALLKSGRARDAARVRQLVRELPEATAEDGYQLALALVKSRRRGLEAPFRRPDPALELLVELDGPSFPVTTRLKRERALDPEELYAIGFALAETSGGGYRLGAEILEHLAKRQPRTKVGKSARNKLRLGA